MPSHNRLSLAPALAAIILGGVPTSALDLKPETIDRWAEYVKTVDAQNQQRLATGHPFLVSDTVPGRAAEIRACGIIVEPAGAHIPLAVSSGLIHDWVGAIFIQGATVSSVLAALRNYGRLEEVYRPNVARVKLISASDSKDHYSMLLMNRSVVSKTALDTEYMTTYTRLDDRRMYSITECVRIQEVAQYGTKEEHTLPEGHGGGLVWGLHTLTRYEERDGGVYLEVEALALSRDIPAAMRWFVEPIVRRVSRASVQNSLRQTQHAVFARSQVMLTTLR